MFTQGRHIIICKAKLKQAGSNANCSAYLLFLKMQSPQIVDNATYAIVSYNWLINPHEEVIPAFYAGKKIKFFVLRNCHICRKE